MSGSLFRNDNDAVGLAMGVVFHERLRWRAGDDAAIHIEAAIVARAPDDGLARLISHGAALMRALGAKGEELLIGSLQNDHPLAAHRDDDELFLLQLACFFASQASRSGGARLREGVEITNDRVGETDEPAPRARA